MRRLRNIDGLTLVELGIASAILAFVLFSSISVASRCMRFMMDTNRTAQGTQILERKLESLRSLSWTDLQNLPGTFTDPDDTAGFFPGTIKKSTLDSYSGSPTLIQVTLSVTYKNATRLMTNSYTTVFSKGGVNRNSN
jgi:hypothetical protein